MIAEKILELVKNAVPELEAAAFSNASTNTEFDEMLLEFAKEVGIVTAEAVEPRMVTATILHDDGNRHEPVFPMSWEAGKKTLIEQIAAIQLPDLTIKKNDDAK